MIPHCLTLSIIRYVSRVKWSNPGKGVAPSPTPRCSSYWKGSFRVAFDYSHQLYLLLLSINHNTSIFYLCYLSEYITKVTHSSSPFMLYENLFKKCLKHFIFNFQFVLATGIGLYVNAHKTEYMCYDQTGDISTLDGTPLELVDKFTYLGSSVASTKKDIDTRLTKAWTAINRLSIIWKSDLTNKKKRSFFLAAVASIQLYGCTTWTLTKRLEKKLDGNYTRMLRAILNKSWRQHATRHQLYGHLPPIQVRRTRHAGHCWRSRDELISDVFLWITTHGRAKAGRPARTYIQQLCEDTGCCPEDLPEAMNDREKWRERVRDIRATSTTWWWWWYGQSIILEY